MIEVRVTQGHYNLLDPREVRTQVWFRIEGHDGAPKNRAFLAGEDYSGVSDGDDPFDAIEELVRHFGTDYLWKGSDYGYAVALRDWMEAHRAEIEKANAARELTLAEAAFAKAQTRLDRAKRAVESFDEEAA